MDNPTDLTKTVEETLENLGVKPGDNLLLALSGGTDSMALLHILFELQGRRGGELAVAHLDHAVRGDESSDDSAYLRSLCSDLGLDLVTDRLDVSEVKSLSRRHRSLEAALRILRYRFLEKAADSKGSTWILTAHQADDQAETVLFRAARHMDWRSLSGIPSKEGRVIRPLLGIRRSVLSDYCAMRKIRTLVDKSNSDLSFSRNRIRHVTLPGMEESFSSEVHDHLIRVSRAALALKKWEEDGLIHYVGEADLDPRRGIIRNDFNRIPSPLKERAALFILEKILIHQPKGSVLREITRLLNSGINGRLRLSDGMELVVESDRIFLEQREKRRSTRSVPEREWVVPGRIEIPELGVILSACESVYDGHSGFPEGNEVLIRTIDLKMPLRVRNRVPGDRFWPLGMKGPKNLNRFLMDRKVPRYDRDDIVLVLDSGGRIIWVAGFEVSQEVRVPLEGSSEAMILKLEKAVPVIGNPDL